MSEIQNKKTLLFFLFIAIILILERLMADVLFDYSFPTIKFLQKFEFSQDFWKLISIFGSKNFKFVLLIIIFSLCNHYHTFVFSLVTFSSLFITSLIKILFQEDRPFWKDINIQAFDCEVSYGFPSNHVTATIPVMLYFWEIIYYRFQLGKSDLDFTLNRNVLIFLNVLFVLLGVSRLYNGVHSLDQVFFGFLFGYLIYYFFRIILEFDIEDHSYLIELLNDSAKAMYFIIVYCFVYTFYLICLFYKKDNFDNLIIPLIEEKCAGHYEYSPYFKCFVDGADYFGILGAFLGIFYDRFRYKFEGVELNKNFIYINENLSQNLKYQVGYWNDTNLTISFVRCLVIYIETYIVFISMKVIAADNVNILVDYLFERCLPAFLVNFMLFNFCKMTTIFIGLANDSPRFKRLLKDI